MNPNTITNSAKSAVNNVVSSIKNVASQQTASATKVQQKATQHSTNGSTQQQQQKHVQKLPSYYVKLNNYFPKHEMKRPDHFQALLKDKPDVYRKDESDDHVLMYSVHSKFQAIDYVWVGPGARGKGLGKKLLNKLKKNAKPIFLEVEQPTEDDPDTFKRLKFYAREGFKHAKALNYERTTITGMKLNMEVLYWTPSGEELSDEHIVSCMREFYEQIHKHRDEDIYGKKLEPSQKVLQKLDEEKDDILMERV